MTSDDFTMPMAQRVAVADRDALEGLARWAEPWRVGCRANELVDESHSTLDLYYLKKLGASWTIVAERATALASRSDAESLGELAALGADGVVVWRRAAELAPAAKCKDLKHLANYTDVAFRVYELIPAATCRELRKLKRLDAVTQVDYISRRATELIPTTAVSYQDRADLRECGAKI